MSTRAPIATAALRDRVAARLFAPASGQAVSRESISRFVIVRELGSGGMGTVYLCRDPMLGRDVAIKVLHARFGEDDHGRVLREARVLATLAHPNIVTVFEVGSHDRQVFLAMEYVDGQSLRDWDARAHPWAEVVQVYIQVATGLAAAHRAGIVHRDVKPSNLSMDRDRRVRVLDFGLAHTEDGWLDAGSDVVASSSSPSRAAEGGTSPSLSRSGSLAGTPEYMAPEQLRGGHTTARSDQWSYCAALWEALYGARPYSTKQVRQLPPLRARARTPLVLEPRGPTHLREILMRGLSVTPDDRWSDMDAIAVALEQVLRGRKRRSTLLAGTAACAVAAGAATLSTGVDPCAPDPAAIDPVWGAEVRASVVADLATGIPEHLRPAADSWLEELDAYREQWLVAERLACRASRGGRQPGTADDARACLLRMREAFGDLVDATRATPSRVVARMGAEGDGAPLNPPSQCIQPRPRVDGFSDVGWSALRQARSALATSSAADARVHAATALEQALQEGSQSGELQARSLLGRIDIALGWTERGLEELQRAVSLAEASQEDRRAAELWLELADAGLMHLHDAAVAGPWLERADAAVGRLQDAGALAFEAARARGVWSSMRGDDSSAQAAFDRAETIADALSMRGERTERLLLDRGNHALSQGDVQSAVSSFSDAANRRAARIGAEHPTMSAVEVALGRAARAVSDHSNARGHFTHAVALIADAFGSDSPRLSSPLSGLAEAAFSSGDIDAAEQTALWAVAVQQALPPTHPDRGGGLALLGMIAEARSDAEQAATWFLAAADARSGLAAPAQRLEAVNNAAWHLNIVGRAGEARPLYQWLEVHTDEDSQMHVFALAGIGRSLYLLGEPERAVNSLEAARFAALRLDDAHPQLLPEIDWHLAAALHDSGAEPSRSQDLAAEALRRYRAEWPDQRTAIADLERITKAASPDQNPVTSGPRGTTHGD